MSSYLKEVLEETSENKGKDGEVFVQVKTSGPVGEVQVKVPSGSQQHESAPSGGRELLTEDL